MDKREAVRGGELPFGDRIKLQRRALPVPRLPVLVVKVPLEPGRRAGGGRQRRHAEGLAHDGVHLLHEHLLLGAQRREGRGGRRRARAAVVQQLGGERAEDEGVFAEFGLEEAVEGPRHGGVEGLGVHGLWDDAVCLGWGVRDARVDAGRVGNAPREG